VPPSVKIACSIFLCLLFYAIQGAAQTPVPAGIGPAVNVSIGYSYVNLSVPSSNRIGMSGADASVTVDFSPRVGVRADLAYVRASNVLGSGNHSDVLSYLGGPVFYSTRHRHLATYAHALVGGARVTGAVPFNGGGFLTGFVNKFSWAVGGGAESRVSSSVALRVGADYLHTAYFDSSVAIRGQANLRIVGSLVYHFGRGSKRSSRNTGF
jgi:opacity protein-like surface antigen